MSEDELKLIKESLERLQLRMDEVELTLTDVLRKINAQSDQPTIPIPGTGNVPGGSFGGAEEKPEEYPHKDDPAKYWRDLIANEPVGKKFDLGEFGFFEVSIKYNYKFMEWNWEGLNDHEIGLNEWLGPNADMRVLRIYYQNALDAFFVPVAGAKWFMNYRTAPEKNLTTSNTGIPNTLPCGPRKRNGVKDEYKHMIK